MKIRSCLLVACIVVVPLIAMFSHRVPPGTRAAVSTWLRDLAGGARPTPAPLPAVVAEPVSARPDTVIPPPAAAAAPLPADAPRVVPVAASMPVTASIPGADGWDRLRELGAVAIDCRPLTGQGGHVASCRLPVDGAGQLERVFQATGEDALAAADNLFRDVAAWKRGAMVARPGTMRF